MCIIRSPPAAYSITKQTCSCVWKHANRLTRNGWRTLLTVSKILFSHIRLAKRGGSWVTTLHRSDLTVGGLWKSFEYLSTSSRATMSPFFRALMANISPVLLYSAKSTCGGDEHFSFFLLDLSTKSYSVHRKFMANIFFFFFKNWLNILNIVEMSRR